MVQWLSIYLPRRPPTSVAQVGFPDFGIICGLSLLLVLVLAPRGFSPGTPISKFQFDLDYCQALYHEPLARESALLTLNKLQLHFCTNMFLERRVNRFP